MTTKKILSILAFVVLAVLLDRFSGYLLSNCYFSDKSAKVDKLVYSVLKTKEDVLVFGSSRAQHHYNSAVLEDSLNLTVFNAGAGGQNIYYHTGILKAAFERYQPKVVLLDMSYIDYEVTPPTWDREKLSLLLPFTQKSDAAKETVLLRGHFEQLKMQSDLYRFNSTIYQIVKNNVSGELEHQQGYVALNHVYNGAPQKAVSAEAAIDSAKLNYLSDFIEYAKSNQAKVIVLVSPHYIEKHQSANLNFVTNLLKEKHGISVWNYEQDPQYLSKKEWFHDAFHLNDAGATVFSSAISKRIKEEVL
ncbi:hypothetical protein [Flavihumibacter sp. UBA7668]|uniref:hypothetical protein n=1 Tax=Flavihumibacter sp. UBA7668 TaxID=1946542 RepID=UPI0025BB2BC0|nr:hypothetical protein [Flavihumibacter sp. UBA7668]